MRGGQAGGMLGSFAAAMTTRPAAAEEEEEGFNYAYVNKDDANVYQWNVPTQSFKLCSLPTEAEIELHKNRRKSPTSARHGGEGRAALHEIVRIESRPLREQFGPGADTGTHTLAGHVTHGDLPRIAAIAEGENKVYVSFSQRIEGRTMAGWMNRDDLTVISPHQYKIINPVGNLLDGDQIMLLKAGTPGLEPATAAAAPSLSSDPVPEINTENCNTWGEGVSGGEGQHDYSASVNVIPGRGGLGGARQGILFLEDRDDRHIPNLILRYQQGGMSSVLAKAGYKQYRYIFIKRKKGGGVGRQYSIVGDEINISNQSIIKPNKDFRITLTGGSQENIERLLNSLPEITL